MINLKKLLSQINQDLGLDLYLVGGCVRDYLLNQEFSDIDLATKALPEKVISKIKEYGKKPYTIGKNFGTIGFWYIFEDKKYFLEITTFRGEIYKPRDRKPEVNFSHKIETDLERRDFTFNAIAINSKGKIVDPFGGQKDLKAGLVRCVGSPKIRFREDPLRILRAVRFAGRYNFQLEAKTSEKIKSCRFWLLDVSKERWVIEMDRILLLPDPRVSLDFMQELSLLQVMIPELSLQKKFDQNTPYHDFDLWTHTKNVIVKVPANNLLLRWVALLHDIAKPFTYSLNKKGNYNYLHHDELGAEMAQKICKYLKFSNDRTEYIVTQIRNHLDANFDLKKYDDAGKKLEPSTSLSFEPFYTQVNPNQDFFNF